ncbi:MAG TPA: bifunctional hydroxymethylpyrimidine kinase/phosphomethylpyrimidine kinase [Candidatus Kapabacteria bacterium]|nr:bifunctional hydroxymethylpyrimidine kinase/phosphomethylpyrimidine kinase [Candidatus Kapabacteria bacterium]
MNVALAIAGSDSSGGAGIQADLKTFEAHGVFGATAVTCITVQNTRSVSRIHPLDPELIRAQIDVVFDDFDVRAVKIGMLSSGAIVRAVAGALRSRAAGAVIVLDPVMVSTSGHRLLDRDAVQALVNELFPLVSLVTPNAAEAAVLGSGEVATLDQMRAAADAVRQLGAAAVLVKGGHIVSRMHGAEYDQSVDLLDDGGEITLFPAPHLATRHTHGTGCTLSSAIAANLANGFPLKEAVARAKQFVHGAIQHAPGIGGGSGPLMHRWQSLPNRND